MEDRNEDAADCPVPERGRPGGAGGADAAACVPGVAVGFRVYYDGGATWDGDPFAAPGLGVLVIVERDPDHGRRLVLGATYYTWTGDRWLPRDEIGFWDYLQQPGPRKVLFGRWVADDVWTDACRRANADPDFPPRTAWRQSEERAQCLSAARPSSR